MRARHVCGQRFEGPVTEVVEAVAEHKQECPAEREAAGRAAARGLHPSAWPVLETV